MERSNSLVTDPSSLVPKFTEFNNIEGYYIKIGYNKGLIITVYNLNALDGRRYENQINIASLYKLNIKFKELRFIKSIYNYIIDLVNENNFRITPEKDSLIFKLILKDDYNQNEVTIYLSNFERNFGNYKNNMEYITILTNEIKRIRNSDLVDNLKQENKNLKEEINELKTILSTNKTLGYNFDSQPYKRIPLARFNEKYNLEIPNNDINKLDLNNKKFGNEILDDLVHVDFNELLKLYLGNNDINDIGKLELLKFDSLEKISLVDNQISDINVFERLQFANLKELFLYNRLLT